MKKIASAFAAVMLAVSLASCASTSETPPAPPVTVTAEPTEPVDNEEVFLEVVRDEHPPLRLVPDQTIIDMAVNACEAFDAGASMEDVFVVIMESSNDPQIQESLAYVVGAGVVAYCPQHQDLVDNLGSSAS